MDEGVVFNLSNRSAEYSVISPHDLMVALVKDSTLDVEVISAKAAMNEYKEVLKDSNRIAYATGRTLAKMKGETNTILIRDSPLIETFRVETMEWRGREQTKTTFFLYAEDWSNYKQLRNRLYRGSMTRADDDVSEAFLENAEEQRLRPSVYATVTLQKETAKFFDAVGPALLSKAIEIGPEPMYVFRGYVPYTVLAKQYMENNRHTYSLEHGSATLSRESFYEEGGLVERATVKEDHLVTLWFPVYINLKEVGPPDYFVCSEEEEQVSSRSDDFYAKGPLGFLTNAYEFPEQGLYYSNFIENDPPSYGRGPGVFFIKTPYYRTYVTLTNPSTYGRREYKTLPKVIVNAIVHDDKENATFKDDMLSTYGLVMSFHMASDKLVPVTRNDRYINTGFRNGPVADFSQPLIDSGEYFETRGWEILTRNIIEGRRPTVHGYPVTLQEFHAAHTAYRNIKRVVSTPNFIAGEKTPEITEYFRLAVSRNRADNLRYIENESDVPKEILARGAKRRKERQAMATARGGEKRTRGEEREVIYVEKKMSTLNFL